MQFCVLKFVQKDYVKNRIILRYVNLYIFRFFNFKLKLIKCGYFFFRLYNGLCINFFVYLRICL